tara:strand:- start:504 stop:899 length:396 start_codon:yes stop_codon:yes gene_type:complete
MNDDINKAMKKSQAVMTNLSEGGDYAHAVAKAEKSLEQHAQQANKEFPEFNEEYMVEQKAKAKSLKVSVLKTLVGQGLSEIDSDNLVEDVMNRYPAQADRIIEGLSRGDLRYVSKEEYEAIKDRFPLMEQK